MYTLISLTSGYKQSFPKHMDTNNHFPKHMDTNNHFPKHMDTNNHFPKHLDINNQFLSFWMHTVILRNIWFKSIKSQHMYKYTLIFRILDFQVICQNIRIFHRLFSQNIRIFTGYFFKTSGFSQVIFQNIWIYTNFSKTTGFTQSFAKNIRIYTVICPKHQELLRSFFKKTSDCSRDNFQNICKYKTPRLDPLDHSSL